MGERPGLLAAVQSSCGRRAALRGTRSRIALAVAAALGSAALPSWAAADDAAAPAAPADATTPANSPGGIAEVVVTARKVAENLQDVPVSLSVYTQKDLENLAITQFEDYATRDPSISFVSTGPGQQQFVIRGVSDGSNPNESNTSLTGFFVDDMSMSWYGIQPDLHLYDIERVEVLKGPQGTTFGAGSMSGAVRYITNKPDVNDFSAGVDFDGGQIQSAGQNLTAEAFLNVPLVQGSTALRLSTYALDYGGFVDNKLVTRDWVNGTVSNNAGWAGNDYNTQHTHGARIALKQVLSDGWSAVATYMVQNQVGHGAWDQQPQYGDDVVARFGPEARYYHTSMWDFHVDGDVGIGDLVFATTYWNTSSHTFNEYSEYMQYAQTAGHAPISPQYLQGFACLTDPVSSPGDSFSGCNVPTLYIDYQDDTRRYSNELRLSSKPGGRLHWLAGLYWEHTEDHYSDNYVMPGIQYGGQAWQLAASYYSVAPTPPPEDWYSYLESIDYLQTTEFANINFDLTERWNIEVGTVHFHSDFTNGSSYAAYSYQPTGVGQVGGPSSASGGSNKWNSKLGLNYHARDNLLLYATFAQGFRDGGINAGFPDACYSAGVPHQYTPDTLNNYELGWKSTMLDQHFLWDGALYYMPWKNFQTALYDPDICTSGTYNANLGQARIYGAESNINFKAGDHWSLQGAVNYTDAELTSNTYLNPYFEVPAGSRLPYAPYFNWSGNVRYETPFSKQLVWYAQYDIAYKGDMYNNLSSETGNGFPRFLQPPYDIMNVRIGLNPADARWLAEFYITNLANKNAIIFTNTGNYDVRYTTNEPRVFGLRLNYRFGKF
jgi:iron complex outermembrane recepter protein